MMGAIVLCLHETLLTLSFPSGGLQRGALMENSQLNYYFNKSRLISKDIGLGYVWKLFVFLIICIVQ